MSGRIKWHHLKNVWQKLSPEDREDFYRDMQARAAGFIVRVENEPEDDKERFLRIVQGPETVQ